VDEVHRTDPGRDRIQRVDEGGHLFLERVRDRDADKVERADRGHGLAQVVRLEGKPAQVDA